MDVLRRGGRREEGSGWGTHVYLWRIHFDIWQNQYNTVKFKNRKKIKKINKVNHCPSMKIKSSPETGAFETLELVLSATEPCHQ